ncbi:hypothetical protein pb186bvf_017944 [Paramecium bursaria]
MIVLLLVDTHFIQEKRMSAKQNQHKEQIQAIFSLNLILLILALFSYILQRIGLIWMIVINILKIYTSLLCFVHFVHNFDVKGEITIKLFIPNLDFKDIDCDLQPLIADFIIITKGINYRNMGYKIV